MLCVSIPIGEQIWNSILYCSLENAYREYAEITIYIFMKLKFSIN